MKTVCIWIFAACVLALTSGCDLENTMTTEVHPDGSIIRTIDLRADSAMLCSREGNRRIPVDPTKGWKSMIILPGGKTQQINLPLHAEEYHKIQHGKSRSAGTVPVRLQRSFSSADDLNSHFRFADTYPLGEIKTKASLRKYFRWFYTYYSYTEVYPRFRISPTAPYERFFTKEEADYWFTGSPNLTAGLSGLAAYSISDKIHRKYLSWLNACLFEDSYRALLTVYHPKSGTDIGLERLKTDKDSIYGQFVANTETPDDLSEILKKYYRTSCFDYLWSEDGAMKQFEEAYGNRPEVRAATTDMTYRLLMPGKTISTNAPISAGDTLQWSIAGIRLLYGSQTLSAESRQINIWAFILFGIILSVASATGFRAVRKRCRRSITGLEE